MVKKYKRIRLKLIKRNISVPLNRLTIGKLDELSEEANIPRAELARSAIRFALKSKKFLDMVKEDLE